ncbi:MAG: hypothetical protein AAB521_01065 [Patescibacteria group bacterium]
MALIRPTSSLLTILLIVGLVIAASFVFVGGFSPLPQNPITDTTGYQVVAPNSIPAQYNLQLRSPNFIIAPPPTPTPTPTVGPTPTSGPPTPTPTIGPPTPTPTPRPPTPTPGPPTPTPTPRPPTPTPTPLPPEPF